MVFPQHKRKGLCIENLNKEYHEGLVYLDEDSHESMNGISTLLLLSNASTKWPLNDSDDDASVLIDHR
jgi:hypothetical protein